MHRPSRPPNPPDGSPAVTATEDSGGDSQPVGAAGASAQTSRSDNAGEKSVRHPSSAGGGEPDSPSWCRTQASLGVFQTRSIFHLPRRSSSGYFSYESDSLPTSPISPRPATTDKSTQTPSPTGQVMKHALQLMTEGHGGGPGMHQQHGHVPDPSSMPQRNTAGDMQAETFGRQLRIIGDDYNSLLMLRRVADRQRRDVIPLNLLPHICQEPVALLCVSFLLLLIGRIMYSQGSTNTHDHSQV
ncbi:bcl-2-like protein 11 [Embiotoca jacksoni]|uniref:bcl-2-like protein 11 n=1 Tax=Embiotoca jacksoni TaxID=100190 RepID=UPI003703F67A